MIVGPDATTLFPGEPSTSRVRLYREDDTTKKWVIHGYLAVDQATELLVAEMFGGGRWVGQLIVAAPDGKQVIKSTKPFVVPGMYRPPQGHLPGLGQPPVSPQAPASAVMLPTDTPYRGNGDRVNVNEALNTVLVDRVLETVRASKEVSASPVPWDKIIEMGFRLFDSLRPNPDAGLRLELERLREEIRRPQQGPVSTGIADAVAAIESLMNVRDRIVPPAGENPEDGEKSMMFKLATSLMQLAANKNGQPAAPAPALAPTTRQDAPVPPTPTGPMLPMWQQMLKHYRNQLLDAASRGLDAEFVAEMAVTYMPANLQGVAVEFVQKPDAAAIAMQEIPELREFEIWNGQFWAALKSAVLGDESEAPS